MISEFALFLFTTLAGAAAGAYVARAIFPLPSDRKNPWLFPLCALVLLGISGIALLLHLGHPERVFNAFTNLGAGIAQEGVTTVLFGLAVLADCVLCYTKKESPRWLAILAAALGVAMTFAMGFAYMAFIGEPAWADASSVALFVLGSLSMGAGLYLAFRPEALGEGSFNTCFIVLQVLGAIGVASSCAHLMGAGFDATGLIAGCVIGPVAAAAAAIAARKSPSATLAYAACVLAIAGMVIARYAYYAACI